MSRFNLENGFEADCDVIYGDTDSVMVDFKVPAEYLILLQCQPRLQCSMTPVMTQEDGHYPIAGPPYTVFFPSCKPASALNINLESTLDLRSSLKCRRMAGAGHRARHGAGQGGGGLCERHLH